jgi:hypothetical protein
MSWNRLRSLKKICVGCEASVLKIRSSDSSRVSGLSSRKYEAVRTGQRSETSKLALGFVKSETKTPSCFLASSDNGFESSKHGDKEKVQSADTAADCACNQLRYERYGDRARKAWGNIATEMGLGRPGRGSVTFTVHVLAFGKP